MIHQFDLQIVFKVFVKFVLMYSIFLVQNWTLHLCAMGRIKLWFLYSW